MCWCSMLGCFSAFGPVEPLGDGMQQFTARCCMQGSPVPFPSYRWCGGARPVAFLALVMPFDALRVFRVERDLPGCRLPEPGTPHGPLPDCQLCRPSRTLLMQVQMSDAV